MTDTEDRSDEPELKDNSTQSEEAVQEKLNRIADKAAKKAGIREKHYDTDHGIFTK